MANELDGSEKNKEMERVLLDVISVLIDDSDDWSAVLNVSEMVSKLRPPEVVPDNPKLAMMVCA